MKKWIVVAALICLAGGTASADVSHEVVVGLEADSTKKVETNTGADLNGKLETKNTMFTVQYTHFFTPLKDDDKPIDLRQFYQHPSTLSAGLGFFKIEDKDSTDPAAISDSKGIVNMLLLGGEYFFPTNTGLFLSLITGSGESEEKGSVISAGDVAIKINMFELGVRQYIGQSAAIHLRIESESAEFSAPGTPVAAPWKETVDRSITFFGIQGVIADVVGLILEIGGGAEEVKSDGITIKADIADINAAVAVFVGKQFSLTFGVEVEKESNARLVAGGPASYTFPNVTERTTLAARYWFSERFGMELPVYSEENEMKTVDPVFGESSYTMTNNGFGLYAAFRF